MSYRGLPNWPPVWTHGYSTEVKTARGELGVLKHVMIHDQIPTKCFLIVEHEAERYTGCLLFDDASFCRQMQTILEAYLGRPIKDIGDLDLNHTL
jgi:hypothetical protein